MILAVFPAATAAAYCFMLPHVAAVLVLVPVLVLLALSSCRLFFLLASPNPLVSAI